MRFNSSRTVCSLVLLIFCFWAVCLHGQTLKVLHNFGGSGDGSDPFMGLIIDPQGNLYGVTYQGGGSGNEGVAFQLVPNADGSWTEKVLHSFGSYPDSNLVTELALDAKGELYGGTSDAGASGSLFELVPGSNGKWSEVVRSASIPSPSGVTLDSAANLYATSTDGGPRGYNGMFVTTSRTGV